VLDVGSGSGFLVACLFEMIEGNGKIVGIEHIKPLVDSSINDLNKNYAESLKAK
jgi:protein-L-isoaspartate(D-aspartate) O-methyltransferase